MEAARAKSLRMLVVGVCLCAAGACPLYFIPFTPGETWPFVAFGSCAVGIGFWWVGVLLGLRLNYRKLKEKSQDFK